MSLESYKLIKRVFILIFYCLISYSSALFVNYVAQARYGIGVRGVQVPVAVLFSWGGLFAKPGASFFICFLYLVCLFLLNSVLGRLVPISVPAIPVVVHAIGSVVAFFRLDRVFTYYASPHQLFWWFCFFVSVPIVLLYISIDWRLVRGSSEPGKHRTKFAKPLPIIAVIVLCILLIGTYELIRVHEMKNKIFAIRKGMTEKEVVSFLNKPLYKGLVKQGEFKNNMLERYPKLTRYHYELSFFYSSGADFYFDDETQKLVHIVYLNR